MIAAQISLINQNAKRYWSSMNTSSGTTSLWSDLPSTTSSAQVSNAYTRLRSMALAYATTGSQYQGNAALLSALFTFLPLLLMAFAVTQAQRWSADEEEGRSGDRNENATHLGRLLRPPGRVAMVGACPTDRRRHRVRHST